MNCLNCQKETINPKYCSRSCGATANNRLYPKRKLTKKCSRCENIIKHQRTKFCSKHLEDYKSALIYKNQTIGYSRVGLEGKHPMYLNNNVRGFARSWLKHLTKLPCRNCGYSKHVELCHIKPVASFPDTATLGEVNSEENVVQLCPNCHWEFDKGLLNLS
jgi:5-methylcytosine-specific restriction endonuclease McrA